MSAAHEFQSRDARRVDQSVADTTDYVYCFHNCRVLRHEKFVRDELWVCGTRIVTPDEGRAYGSRVIRRNCFNKIIAPGFIDIQVNGAYGVDFSATDDLEQALKKCSLLISQTGCTSYLPTLITSSSENYSQRLPKIKYTPGSSRQGATVLGIHAEGPLISMVKRGCHPPQLIKSIPKMNGDLKKARAFLDEVYGQDRSNIVLLTLAPEYEGALEVIEALTREGILVSMGHSEASFDRGCQGVSSGASALTHLFSAMNAFGHKEPALPGLISGQLPREPPARLNKLSRMFHETRVGSFEAGLRVLPPLESSSGQSVARSPTHGLEFSQEPDVLSLSSDRSDYCSKRLYYGLIADCIHTHPYSLRIAYKANRHGLCLITDAMAALGLPDGSYMIGETEVEVGGSPRKALKKGTDTLAGVVASLDQCVRLFAQQTDCGLPYALTAASLHPAQCLGIDRWKGQLDPGSDADFILLDDDVKISETWCMGELVYDSTSGLNCDAVPSEFKAMTHIVPPEAQSKITTY